jgi:hypothetical protein
LLASLVRCCTMSRFSSEPIIVWQRLELRCQQPASRP